MPKKFWTSQRLFELAGYLEQGKDDTEIAALMGTSANGVRIARKRNGLRSRTAILLSAQSISKLLGVGCAKTITHWIELGHLKGRRGQVRGPNRQWYVRKEALLAFLEDPDTHHLWQPDRITDSGLRQWAAELWTGPFLTPGQVADRCFVLHSAVNDWIHRGLLPAVKNGNWWIRESDLEGFVPPNQRSKVGCACRRYGPMEDELLFELRAKGYSYPRIAKHMGRTIGSVYQRYQLLLQRVDVAA